MRSTARCAGTGGSADPLNLSAHADYAEILEWLYGFRAPPRQTFITHGEPTAADALRHRIEEQKRWRCRVPDYREQVELA